MGLFGRKKRPSNRRRSNSNLSLEERQEKVEKSVAWNSFLRQMKENPELEKAFALQKLGIKPVTIDPVIQKKNELRGRLLDEATNMITTDPELRKQYAETLIGEVIGPAAMARLGNNGDDNEGYDNIGLGMGSSLNQALEDIETLGALQDKMGRLGLGGQQKSGMAGFLDGIKLADVIQLIPLLTGKAAPVTEQHVNQPMYIVEVDGKSAKVTEAEYKQLSSEGRIRPYAQLDMPAEKDETEKPETKDETKTEVLAVETIENEEVKIKATSEPLTEMSSSQETLLYTKPKEETSQAMQLPSIDFLLDLVDLDTIHDILSKDVEDAFTLLQNQMANDDPSAIFLWGMFGSSDYDGVMNVLYKYSGDSRINPIIERLTSDDGIIWLNRIIELVKEIS